MKEATISRSSRAKRSDCPVSNTLDILGDRWTLIVVRDLFLGKRRYGELAAATEKIPTNILADRLKLLQAYGVIERMAYQERPKRYEYRLTEKGRDLAPVLRAMVKWGRKHTADR
jgi:DNA-binding HxlR family transcriptional regulator